MPDIIQDCEVYELAGKFHARGRIDGAKFASSVSAAETIQGAIDSLGKGGGEVRLHRGVYPLDAPLTLADSVTLRGCGRASRLSVTDRNEAGIAVLCEKLTGALVTDLSAAPHKGAKSVAGVVLDDCGDCKVTDVFCASFDQYGIWMRNNSFLCEIRGCTLAGNGDTNLYLDHLREGRYGQYIPNLVTNCIVYGGGKGIVCDGTIVANIIACAVYQTGGYAYHVHSSSNSVLISGCRSFQISDDCVVLEDTHEFNCSSNIFCWHTGHGIVIRNARWGAICGNEIIDTGSYNPDCPNFTRKIQELTDETPLFNGIELVDAHGYSVQGNTLFNWAVAPPMRIGIREDADSFKNIIGGNNVNYYKEEAVRSEGKETVVGENVGHAKDPHQGWDHNSNLQTFHTQLTRDFIALQATLRP